MARPPRARHARRSEQSIRVVQDEPRERREGLSVVVATRPRVAGRRLAVEYGGEFADGLAAAAKALASRRELLAHLEAVERAQRAMALAATLADFDEAADARLIARKGELTEALALAPDASVHLVELGELLSRLEDAQRRRRLAEQSLEQVAARIGTVPAATECGALREAWLGVRAADAELELAAKEGTASTTRGHGLVESRASSLAAAGELESARQKWQLANQRASALTQQAATIGAVGVGVLGGALVGLVPTVLALVAIAAVPPAIEFLRRARSIRTAADIRLRGAEARSQLADQEHLGEAEIERLDRLDLDRRLNDAQRRAADAHRRWRTVAGPDLELERAEEVMAAIELRDQHRQALSKAQTAENDLRREMSDKLVAIRLTPGDDLAAALERLRHLVVLRPQAAPLLEVACAAQRRCVERDALASLVGSRDLGDMQRLLAAPRPTEPKWLVIVDDEEEAHEREARAGLDELAPVYPITVVTTDADRWARGVLPPPALDPDADELDDDLDDDDEVDVDAAKEAAAKHRAAPHQPELPWFVSR